MQLSLAAERSWSLIVRRHFSANLSSLPGSPCRQLRKLGYVSAACLWCPHAYQTGESVSGVPPN